MILLGVNIFENMQTKFCLLFGKELTIIPHVFTTTKHL